MSWKSFVTAGLLCVVVSPAFAAPRLRVINGPALNAQGNWVWNVTVESGFADTPIAAELGFDANRDVVSATKGTLFDGANTDNPGSEIFGWETDGSSGFPEGVQIGTDANIDKVFAAIGSEANLPNSPTQSTVLTIVTTGPTNTALTGNLLLTGAYGAGGDEGRIAELTGTTTSANYRYPSDTASRTIVNGDINLSGVTDGADFAIFGGEYQPTVPDTGGWTHGDFNRDGFVDGADFAIFGGAYNPTAAPGGSTTNLNILGILDPPPGGGSLASGIVPEPASFALAGLAVLGGLGLLRRRS